MIYLNLFDVNSMTPAEAFDAGAYYGIALMTVINVAWAAIAYAIKKGNQ